jgi:hypothetical protein
MEDAHQVYQSAIMMDINDETEEALKTLDRAEQLAEKANDPQLLALIRKSRERIKKDQSSGNGRSAQAAYDECVRRVENKDYIRASDLIMYAYVQALHEGNYELAEKALKLKNSIRKHIMPW